MDLISSLNYPTGCRPRDATNQRILQNIGLIRRHVPVAASSGPRYNLNDEIVQEKYGNSDERSLKPQRSPQGEPG